jgi:hypothetical protein
MADNIIQSRGHADRVSRVASTFVQRLRSDVRVHAAFEQWCVAHGLSLEMGADERRRAVLRDRDRDLAELERFVREDLGLSFSWLPLALLEDFALIAVSRGAAWLEGFDAPLVPGLPQGRAPRGGGEYLARDVDWYYRTQIQQPSESMYAIGQDYRRARASGTHYENPDGIVNEAVRRMKVLLSTLELGDEP